MGMAVLSSERGTQKLASRPVVPQQPAGRFLQRNQMARRALLRMDGRKPYETPHWRPGNGYREAMCCSFCGGRDRRYEDCPQRDPAANPPLDAPDRVTPKPN
jgi:hypothetical protein